MPSKKPSKTARGGGGDDEKNTTFWGMPWTVSADVALVVGEVSGGSSTSVKMKKVGYIGKVSTRSTYTVPSGSDKGETVQAVLLHVFKSEEKAFDSENAKKTVYAMPVNMLHASFKSIPPANWPAELKLKPDNESQTAGCI